MYKYMMVEMQKNCMRRDELNRMACGWMVRGGIAAVEMREWKIG